MYVCLHKTGKPRARAPCKAKGNCSKWPVCSAILAVCPPVLGTALKIKDDMTLTLTTLSWADKGPPLEILPQPATRTLKKCIFCFFVLSHCIEEHNLPRSSAWRTCPQTDRTNFGTEPHRAREAKETDIFTVSSKIFDFISFS